MAEAAAKRRAPELTRKLAAFEATRHADDPLALWREALQGGDAERGEKIFWNHEAAVCTRCHAMQDSGGNAGPPLHQIGSRLSREQILEALALPQARIADGYGTVVVMRKAGDSVAGILKGDDGKILRVQTPEGEIVEVPTADVANKTSAISAMPPMAAILSKRQLRDVVEFLSRQK